MSIHQVCLSKKAQRQLRLAPKYIVAKLQFWLENVNYKGLYETRKIPGFHDEPLKGARLGQRSIRLNRCYRAIYQIKDNKITELVEILEVNKHEY